MRLIESLTGVSEPFARSNNEKTVTARFMAVYAMNAVGFSDGEIAERTGLTRQAVNKLRNSYRERVRRRVVKEDLQRIDNALATDKF